MKAAVPKAPIHAHRGDQEWGEDPESCMGTNAFW